MSTDDQTIEQPVYIANRGHRVKQLDELMKCFEQSRFFNIIVCTVKTEKREWFALFYLFTNYEGNGSDLVTLLKDQQVNS